MAPNKDKSTPLTAEDVERVVLAVLFRVGLPTIIVVGTIICSAIMWYVNTRTSPDTIRKQEQRGAEYLAKLQREADTRQLPVLGLLTDFGTGAYYLGKLRGRLCGTFPHLQLVDISHEVPGLQVGPAGWVLMNATKDFRPGSVILFIVNPGADLSNAVVVVTKKPHLVFIGAHFEVLNLVAAEFGVESAHLVQANDPDDTFGISTLAPVVEAALQGKSVPEMIAANLLQTKPLPYDTEGLQRRFMAREEAGGWRGMACSLDRWGNIQTNVPPGALARGSTFTVTMRGRTLRDVVVGKSYDAGNRRGGVIIQQDGYMQVARYLASAGSFFGGFQFGDSVRIAPEH